MPTYPAWMPGTPIRYQSPEEDSGRWTGFPFRSGDVVISTRSKSGTTWVQMICALLIFQRVDLPEPLARLSPWLDWLIRPTEEVFAQLAAQDHRRFIKTHTPLDGVPADARATYLVTGRHPLDMAVSMYHQGENIDRRRLRQLLGRPEPEGAPPDRPPVRQWLLAWIDADPDPRQSLDSLPGVMWHLTDAWGRRGEPNVALVHFDDLLADLGSEMRRLADLLEIAVPEQAWEDLVAAATFTGMRASAERVVPDPVGVLKDASAFLRQGTSGAGRALLKEDELRRYHQRAAQLAPGDLLEWLHRPTSGQG
jgi:aryl sulfotransferase